MGDSAPSPMLMYGAGLAVLTSVGIMAFAAVKGPNIDLPAGALDRDRSLELCADHGLESRLSSIPGAGGGIYASKPFKQGSYVCFYDGFDQEVGDEDTNYEYTLHHQTGDGHRVGYLEPQHPCGVGQLVNDRAMIEVATRTGTLDEAYAKIRDYQARSQEGAVLAWMQDESNPFMLFATEDIKPGQELFATYGPAYWLGDIDDERKYPTPMARLLGCLVHTSWRDVVNPEDQPARGGMSGHLRKTCVTLTTKDDDGNVRIVRPTYDAKSKALKLLTPKGTLIALDDNAAASLMADFLRIGPSSTLWARLDEAIASGSGGGGGAQDTPSKASSLPTAKLSAKGRLRRLVSHLSSGGRAIDHPFELSNPHAQSNESDDEDADEAETAATAEAGAPKSPKQGKRRKGKRKPRPKPKGA